MTFDSRSILQAAAARMDICEAFSEVSAHILSGIRRPYIEALRTIENETWPTQVSITFRITCYDVVGRKDPHGISDGNARQAHHRITGEQKGKVLILYPALLTSSC